MATEGTTRLKQISKDLQELDHSWRTIKPAVAEDLARLFEQRSRLWKRRIALQSAALMLVQAVATEGDVLSDASVFSLEAENAEESGDPSFSADPDLMNSDLIEETKQLLSRCPQKWAEVTELKASIWSRINALVEHQLIELENQPENDWAKICESMKFQRESLEKEIENSKERLTNLEENEAKMILKDLHREMDTLKKYKKSIAEIVKSRSQMESVLEEYHGISVPGPDTLGELSQSEAENLKIDPNNIHDYLLEEQDAMISFYEAKMKRNSRIIDVTLAKDQTTNNVSVTITPKSEWLEYWRRRKQDHPGLKYVTVTYSKNSTFPLNIAIKVNTSNVSATAFDAVLGPLVQKIQEWKQKMMESPSLDIYGLVKLFL